MSVTGKPGQLPYSYESSFKTEGAGSAIVTDIAVKLLSNLDSFKDTHPDLDNDDGTSGKDVGTVPVIGPEAQNHHFERRKNT
ncbi:hypothetical protein F4810DRAFT_710304 [Camillea tinctor]|nr:hypothetical protein F4810DRAFT_710304 [Camillea tinctor]